jgi:hypothetical protein
MNALRFEVFTAVKIQVEVLWVVTPCRRPSLEGTEHLQKLKVWEQQP